ncbi:hypothetical protein GCM10009773_02440 [Williamsia serinedens]
MIALVGLVAPDDTQQASDQAAAVTRTTTETVATSSPEPTSTSTPVETTSPPADSGAASAALATLETLPVKGRAPKTGYSRAQFGQAWSDDVDVAFGHNGCDTRNDVLRRDLTGVVARPGTRDCVVLSGTLADPYTGRSIPFTRGERTSEAVQIATSSPCPTPGRKARSNSRPTSAATSPTTPATCRPPTARRTSRRATATLRPGCRRAAPTAAPMSSGRSR